MIYTETHRGIPFDGYVLQNGNYCITVEDGETNVIWSNPIPASQIQILLDLSNQYDFPVILMESGAIYATALTPQLIEAQKSIGTSIPMLEPDPSRPLRNPIYLATPFTTPALQGLVEKSLPLCDCTYWPTGTGSDLIAKGGDKPTGIQKVMEHFGYAREEIAAIGDGENDISMMKFAGIGIAMGNAEEAVKQAADYVTDPLSEDGLLHAVEYLIRFHTPSGTSQSDSPHSTGD